MTIFNRKLPKFSTAFRWIKPKRSKKYRHPDYEMAAPVADDDKKLVAVIAFVFGGVFLLLLAVATMDSEPVIAIAINVLGALCALVAGIILTKIQDLKSLKIQSWQYLLFGSSLVVMVFVGISHLM